MLRSLLSVLPSDLGELGAGEIAQVALILPPVPGASPGVRKRCRQRFISFEGGIITLQDGPAVIETRHLCREFDGRMVVRELTLTVPKGAVFAFLGPNGAGKSTTIRMLLGLLVPTAGTLSVLGGGPATNPDLRSRIGALIEGPSVYPHLTARQNLEISRRLRAVEPARVDSVLEEVGLTYAADRKVHGFSTGMRQRLALGLALLDRPELLILDEPTSGLDPSGIKEVRTLIRRISREDGRTVFVSSHQLAEVQAIATHVAILDEGQLRFQGSIEELNQLYRRNVHIVIETSFVDDCIDLLRRKGWELVQSEESAVHVRERGDNRELERIAAVLLDADLPFFGLHLAKPTLEDLFFGMLQPRGAGH